jgi:hypothetical protein
MVEIHLVLGTLFLSRISLNLPPVSGSVVEKID